MALSVGDEAPDFTLNDQTRSPVTLSDFRGKKHVLVIFYPLAFSGVCTGELCALRGTFLVDIEGVIRFTETNAIPDARDQQRWRTALAELGVAV